MKIECPRCYGASGFTDYWGEWAECECCNPDGNNESGRIWIWQWWRFKFYLWRLDRLIDREMSREV